MLHGNSTNDYLIFRHERSPWLKMIHQGLVLDALELSSFLRYDDGEIFVFQFYHNRLLFLSKVINYSPITKGFIPNLNNYYPINTNLFCISLAYSYLFASREVTLVRKNPN